MVNVNVETQSSRSTLNAMLNANVGFTAPLDLIWPLRGCFWVPLGLHMAAQRLHMAAHGVHMAAQRLHLGALGAAYGR